MRPLDINTGASGVKLVYANSVILKDHWEDYLNYHVDWNFSAMNGLARGSEPQSMVYLSYE